MVKLALYARLEAKPGKEKEVEQFLQSAVPLVEEEQGTITWYALRMGPSTFGIFDTFNDEAGRQAHLSGKVAAALMAEPRPFREGSRNQQSGRSGIQDCRRETQGVRVAEPPLQGSASRFPWQPIGISGAVPARSDQRSYRTSQILIAAYCTFAFCTPALKSVNDVRDVQRRPIQAPTDELHGSGANQIGAVVFVGRVALARSHDATAQRVEDSLPAGVEAPASESRDRRRVKCMQSLDRSN